MAASGSSSWHPVLAAGGPRPGVWELADYAGRVYGVVELRRTEAGPMFRCAFEGSVIGWSTTLRQGCVEVHKAFLRGHGPGGGPLHSAERHS